MKSESLIVVYGSYGYTGRLIIAECLKRQQRVMLAGRNQKALHKQSETTGYPYQVVEVYEKEKLLELLRPAQLVIHCGGPFMFTAKRMVDACLATKTHYTDITGEIAVFELLKKYSDQGVKEGIMILPGSGFDVVPTDCLALHLKERLPDATHLELAFATSGGGASRGTTKTALLGLGEGSRIRLDGKIVSVPLHQGMKEINFGTFKSIAARIPWGDIATAHFSTGIPNIAVYMAITKKLKRLLKASQYLNWLLSSKKVKRFLLKRADKMDGPTEAQRASSKSYVKGKAWNNKYLVESSLEMQDGYSFTAKASVEIAHKIIAGNFKTGYQTPSSVYGSNFILEFSGTTRRDLTQTMH